MITIQHLMSEHFSDSISNRSAQPEKNTAHKKYLTRLIDHNHIDQPCDKESSPTDLPESWSHKELLHNRYGLINHGNQIIPVTHKEVYILSRPSKLQPITDYTIVTQYISREKDQDLPQLPSTLEPQEKITLEDQSSTLRCSDVRETRHTHNQLTESVKAKFQTPFTSNEARNYVEHNSVESISQGLVHPTKSDTASASLISKSEEREEITAETAEVPAPALKRDEEQSQNCRYTCTCTGELRNSPTLQNPKSHYMNQTN